MIVDFEGERLDIHTVELEDFVAHLVRYDFARKLAKGDVLDIACGVGYGSLFLCTNKDVTKVVGADISDIAVSYAKRTFSHPKLIYGQESASNTHYKDGTFDTIISLETVEHLEDLQAYFKEVKRLLRPAGNLILSIPNKKFFIDAGFENKFHFNEMYYKDLLGLLTDALGNVHIYYQHYNQDTYDRINPQNNLNIKRYGIWLKFIPKVIKKLLKTVLKEIKYAQQVKKSALRKYGNDFDKLLNENESIAKLYNIELVQNDVYNRVPGNFVVVWKREE